MAVNPVIVKLPGSGSDYLRTIAALTVVLELTERKLKQIRSVDGRAHHVAAQGHLRTALDYERKVLSELMDPKGMAALTSTALQEVLALSSSGAFAILEQHSDPGASIT